MKTKINSLFFSILLILSGSTCVDTTIGPQITPTDTGKDVRKQDTQDTTDTDAKDIKEDLVQTECVPTCSNGQVCKIDGFVCVDCLGDTDCSNQVCNTDLNTCADCLDNTFCTDATNSKCSAGSCGACSMDADCVHIAGDLPRCDAGTCKVACEDDSHCGGKVCDVTTNTCTTDAPMTASQCEPCVSDTQCETDFHCIPLGFGDPTPVARGNYCLQIKPAVGCDKPYRSVINRASLSGAAPEDHCGINENKSTCEAVLSATSDTSCKDDNDPLIADPTKCLQNAGARCENLGGGWTCTYNCDGNDQCQSNKTCTPAMNGYCQ